MQPRFPPQGTPAWYAMFEQQLLVERVDNDRQWRLLRQVLGLCSGLDPIVSIVDPYVPTTTTSTTTAASGDVLLTDTGLTEWETPAGVFEITVSCLGGGGNGGSSGPGGAAGGGGGGGGMARGVLVVSESTPYVIRVGTAGQSSRFSLDGSTYPVEGGQGAVGGSGAGGFPGAGGGGGSGTGDVTHNGGNGGGGTAGGGATAGGGGGGNGGDAVAGNNGAAGSGTTGGAGGVGVTQFFDLHAIGSTAGTGGVGGGTSGSAGSAGVLYGSGGGGCAATSTSPGVGRQGAILIEW